MSKSMTLVDTFDYLSDNGTIDKNKMQSDRFYSLVYDALRVLGAGLSATARCTKNGLVIKDYNGQKTIKWEAVITRNY